MTSALAASVAQKEPLTRVPFFDASAQIAELMPELRPAMDAVIASQKFVLGSEVEAFERELAAYVGVRHAVGVSSGTDALIVALLALGIGPGAEVITTPYSFFASTGAILRVGARPVFADIDPDSFNLDPARVSPLVSERTRAILPVHLFGQTAEMGELQRLAERHALFVIEDAAQAIGAEYRGRRAGALGTVGCFSFFPTKNLGGFGDGGMLTTDDAELAARARSIRSHGFGPKHHSRLLGGNFRLDALQAAVLRVKLRHLEGWNERRRANARRYAALLEPAADALRLPAERLEARHVYNQFVVRSGARDALQRHLSALGVGTERYYPIPIHLQDSAAALGYREGSLVESERAARECLALPIYPELSEPMLERVATAILAFSTANAQGL